MSGALFAAGTEAALLDDSVARFLDREWPFAARRAQLAADPASRGLWQQLAELGWLGLPFAESDGGIGAGWGEMAIVMRRCGRALALEPLIPSVALAGNLIAQLGTAAQRQRHLAPLIEGRAQLALAYLERGPRERWELARLAASPHGDGRVVLGGRKTLVLGAPGAEAVVVLAREDPGLSLFVVERGSAGLDGLPYRTVCGHAAGELVFNGVMVPAGQRLGSPGGAAPALQHALDTATAMACAEALGVIEMLFESTLDYTRQRRQFGRALSANQALQHRLVDMHVQMREAEVMAQSAVQALRNDDATARSRAVSAAKLHINGALRLVGQEAVQLHGAIGTTEDCAISHAFKRATTLSLLFGDADHHRQRLAAALRAEHTTVTA